MVTQCAGRAGRLRRGARRVARRDPGIGLHDRRRPSPRPSTTKNLGSEELGSIYESLLELHPELNIAAGSFELKTAAGHERKTTGSYYTPAGLVSCLLDSSRRPVPAGEKAQAA